MLNFDNIVISKVPRSLLYCCFLLNLFSVSDVSSDDNVVRSPAYPFGRIMVGREHRDFLNKNRYVSIVYGTGQSDSEFINKKRSLASYNSQFESVSENVDHVAFSGFILREDGSYKVWVDTGSKGQPQQGQSRFDLDKKSGRLPVVFGAVKQDILPGQTLLLPENIVVESYTVADTQYESQAVQSEHSVLSEDKASDGYQGESLGTINEAKKLKHQIESVHSLVKMTTPNEF